MKLHISKGNKKLGSIANTSFPPIITCRKNVPCAADGCYALKFYTMYPSCRGAWNENLALWYSDTLAYTAQLRDALKTQKYFRYFVSGDIPDSEYFGVMMLLAKQCPHTEFLCFTKQYEIVNDWLSRDHLGFNAGEVPKNLHLILSTWEGFEPENPYNLPTSAVITPDMEVIPDDWKICGGNCQDCICRGVGCWELKNGETIAFHKH